MANTDIDIRKALEAADRIAIVFEALSTLGSAPSRKRLGECGFEVVLELLRFALRLELLLSCAPFYHV